MFIYACKNDRNLNQHVEGACSCLNFMQTNVCLDEPACIHFQQTNWVFQAVPLSEMHLFRLAC